MAYPSQDAASNPPGNSGGLLNFNLAIAAALFVIMGVFFVLISNWHEGAVFAQGFLISLILLIVLADASNINSEIGGFTSTLAGFSNAHKVN